MNLLHMKNQRKLCTTYNWLNPWNCCTSVYPMVQKNQISRSKAATPKSMFSALVRIQLRVHRSLASLHAKAKEHRYDNNRDWMMVRHGIGHGLAIRFLILLEWSNHPHHRIFKQPQVLFLFYTQHRWSDTPFYREHGPNGFVRQQVYCHAIWTNFALLYVAEKQMSKNS